MNKKEKKPKVIKQEKPKDINTALFAFQGEKITVARNGSGNIGGRVYKYATLDDIIEKIRPELQKHGIMISQTTDNEHIYTDLIHVDSGTKIQSNLKLGNPASSQDLGSRITYLRRYMLTAMLGLNLEDDVDGMQAKAEKMDGPLMGPSIKPPTVESTGLATPVGETTIPESDAFKKAKTAIETCHSIEALNMLSERVKVSPNLTERERIALEPVVEAKKAAIENPAK